MRPGTHKKITSRSHISTLDKLVSVLKLVKVKKISFIIGHSVLHQVESKWVKFSRKIITIILMETMLCVAHTLKWAKASRINIRSMEINRCSIIATLLILFSRRGVMRIRKAPSRI